MLDVHIPEPPQSACGSVKEEKIYLRGQGGGGWGGGEGGTGLKFVAIWPAAGDDTGAVTATSKRTTTRLVDFDAVLGGAPESDWLIGNSRLNWLDKQWELHEVTVFGMTAKQRLDHGILDGVTTVAEAQAALTTLRPSRNAWAKTARALENLSLFTIDHENLHPHVLRAYEAYGRAKPFLVLARMHELLRKTRVPADVRKRALVVIEYLAPEDLFWLQMEAADVHTV